MSTPDRPEFRGVNSIEDVGNEIVNVWLKEYSTQFLSKQAKELSLEGYTIPQAISLSVLRWLEKTTEPIRNGRPLGQTIFEESEHSPYLASVGITFGFLTPFGVTELASRLEGPREVDEHLMSVFEQHNSYAARLRKQNPNLYQKRKSFFREGLLDSVELYMDTTRDLGKAKQELEKYQSGLGTMIKVLEDFQGDVAQRNTRIGQLTMEDFGFPLTPEVQSLLRKEPILLGSVIAANLYGLIYGTGFASDEEKKTSDEVKARKFKEIRRSKEDGPLL